MSLKRKLENGISVGGSLVGLLWRRLLGNSVQFAPVTLVSLGASLKTYDGGAIRIGRKAGKLYEILYDQSLTIWIYNNMFICLGIQLVQNYQ